MEKPKYTRLQKLLIITIIINALITGYLVKNLADQNRRIHTLERNDSIKQSVDKLNTKVDGLKDRIQGLFR